MKPYLLVLVLFISELNSPNILAQTQSDINYKARADFEAADHELNKLYEALFAKLDVAGQQKLAAAQQAWTVYREKEAAFEADEVRGGTLMPSIVSVVRMEITRERIQRLRKLMPESNGQDKR